MAVNTSTVKSSGGDYSSLSAWEADTEIDLVSAGDIEQAECYGFQDATQVNIAGATVDASNYRRVYAASGAEAQLPYDTSGAAYRLEPAENVAPLAVSEGHVRIERIQVKLTMGDSSSRDTINTGGNTGVRCVGVIALLDPNGKTNTAQGFEASISGAGNAAYFINCVAIGYNTNASSSGFQSTSGSGVAHFYNCTAYGCYNGFWTGGGSIVLNCLSFGNSSGAFAGTPDGASDHNASDDATGPGANSVDSLSDPFVDAAGGNFHVTRYGIETLVGDDLSSDTDYPFSDDIEGDARSRWVIGADEPKLSTIKSSGGDYTTIGAWEAGEQADLSGGGPCFAEFYALEDDNGSSQLTIDGWTTTAADYIELFNAASAYHGGVWSTSAYRLVQDAGPNSIAVSEAYVRFTGLQFGISAPFGGRVIFNLNSHPTTCDIRVDKCILREESGSANACSAFSFGVAAGATIRVTNSVLYDFSSRAFGFENVVYGNTTEVVIEHVTMVGCALGIGQGGANLTLVNVGYDSQGIGGADGFGTGSGGYSSSCRNCASDLASDATNLNGSGHVDEVEPTYVDEGGDDFHLASGDSAWRGAGYDSPTYVIDDIDGETRSAWDIGADEYVAAGGETGAWSGGANAGDTWGAVATSLASLAAEADAAASLAAGAGAAGALVAGVAAGETFSGVAAAAGAVLAAVDAGDASSSVAGALAALAAAIDADATLSSVAGAFADFVEGAVADENLDALAAAGAALAAAADAGATFSSVSSSDETGAFAAAVDADASLSAAVAALATLGSLAPDVILDGGFDTGTPWTTFSGWAISGGVAVATNAAGSLVQENPGALGSSEYVEVEFDVSAYVQGSLDVKVGEGLTYASHPDYVPIVADGHYRLVLQSLEDDRVVAFKRTGATTLSLTLDNVTVRPVAAASSASAGETMAGAAAAFAAFSAGVTAGATFAAVAAAAGAIIASASVTGEFAESEPILGRVLAATLTVLAVHSAGLTIKALESSTVTVQSTENVTL